MPAETLVEALEKAGAGIASVEIVCPLCTVRRGRVVEQRVTVRFTESDADVALRISARFASPEAKREVLAALLKERLEAIADPGGYVYLGTLNSGAQRLSKVDRVMELLLAPEAR